MCSPGPGQFTRNSPPRMLYLDVGVQSAMPAADRYRGAGAGAARQSLAGAALVDAQADVRAVQDFHEADVHALRESADAIRCAGPSRSTGAASTEATVSTACGLPIETAPISTSLPADFQSIDVSFAGGVEGQRARIEIGHTHVDGDNIRTLHAGMDQARGAVHGDFAGGRAPAADAAARRCSARRCRTARPRGRRR